MQPPSIDRCTSPRESDAIIEPSRLRPPNIFVGYCIPSNSGCLGHFSHRAWAVSIVSNQVRSRKAMSRNTSIDVSRGLLMFYIIGVIHAYWLIDGDRSSRSWLLFEMPIIFLISGATFSLSPLARTPFADAINDYPSFIASRFSRVLIPYLLYALASACIVRALGGHGSFRAILFDWLNPITYGSDHNIQQMSWHLWFVWVFLAVTLLLPLSTQIDAPKKVPPAIIFIGIWAILFCCQLFQIQPSASFIISYTFWAWFGAQLQCGNIENGWGLGAGGNTA
jgi:hypothetical protein